MYHDGSKGNETFFRIKIRVNNFQTFRTNFGTTLLRPKLLEIVEVQSLNKISEFSIFFVLWKNMSHNANFYSVIDFSQQYYF